MNQRAEIPEVTSPRVSSTVPAGTPAVLPARGLVGKSLLASRTSLPSSSRGADARPKPAARGSGEGAGALRSEVTLTLQTRSASGLWHGRKAQASGKNYILPVTRFAELMRQIETSCANDDPYADWWFIQMEESLEQARVSLRKLAQEVETWTANEVPEGINVTEALSQDPEVVEVRFTAALAIQGAFLVAEYDKVARKVLLARHIGIINRDVQEAWLTTGQRAVRAFMQKVTGWKFTAVCRDDMAANNQRAQRAIEEMGQCPPDILIGDRRSLKAPVIRRKGGLGQPVVGPAAEGDGDVDLSDLEG